MKHNIVIDNRMVNNSGIGTYLQNIVPIITNKLSSNVILLENNIYDKAETGKACCKDNKIYVKASIYSVSEQLEVFSKLPHNISLFWSPHYNIPILYRGKLMVTIHDVFHLAMPQYTGGVHKRLYARLMFDAVRKKADAIVCDSDFTRSEFTRLAGAPSGTIQTIHLGIGKEFYAARGTSTPPHVKPYLLYIGNVKPHKNLVRLIEAFSLIVNEVPHDLLIVGQKEGFITKDRHVGALAEKLRDRVQFTGYVADEVLRRYYACADGLILPSLYEGFGLPPLEAMACGCPTVSSNAASLPEVCGDATLYCNPYDTRDIADKIRMLLTDETLRADLRQKGLTHVKRFTWEKCAEQTLRVIEGLL